jgi:hypothetical protein
MLLVRFAPLHRLTIQYTVSGFLLKFNRNALKRCSRAHLAVVLSACITASVVILNLVINRPAVLYTFGAVLFCILAFLLTFQNVVGAAKWALYCLENLTWLRRRAKRWSKSLITVIRNLKSREICVWVKTDEVSSAAPGEDFNDPPDIKHDGCRSLRARERTDGEVTHGSRI